MSYAWKIAHNYTQNFHNYIEKELITLKISTISHH